MNFSSRLNVYLCRKAFILLSHLVCLLQKRVKRSRRGWEEDKSGRFSSKLSENDIERRANFPARQREAKSSRISRENFIASVWSSEERREHDNQITIIL